jgi:RNA polymerase sigma factor (TIGR02999 family)
MNETPLTALLEAADRGEPGAAETLFTALYAELHRMARRELARLGGPVTLGATTLLHEAYLNLAGRDEASFPDRARFMAYAARVMRGLIIDHARRRQAQKRGGRFELTTLDTGVGDSRVDARELEGIGEALDELAQADASLAEVVDLNFFCGFTFEEIAAMKGQSERTVRRSWEKARLFLYRRLRPDLPDPV